MRQIWPVPLNVILFALLSFHLLPAAFGQDSFLIETKRESDRVEVKTEPETTILSVHSPTGIGQAIVYRKDEYWPKRIEVRLYLKGLESFQISTSQTTLNAAATGIQNGELKLRVWKDDNEECLLTKDSRYWPDLRIGGVNKKADATVPLTSGYFVAFVPTALVADNPKSITLKWIDFYRN